MAGGKSDVLANDFLSHYFLNTAITNVGDAAGLLASASPGSLYVALCTSEPGDDGDPAGHEATYTGYARVAIARNGTQWELFDDAGEKKVRNKLLTEFAAEKGDAGSVTITWFAVSRTASAFFDYWGQVTDPVGGLIIGPNVLPRIKANLLVISED